LSTFNSFAVAAQMIAGEALVQGQFPRMLQDTAPLALPVSVSMVASLTTRKVQHVLFQLTGRPSTNIVERRLRGCLVAHKGQGMIFLDEDDPAAVRFAAAHEIAHFVGHYLDRRRYSVVSLGSEILEVLDGLRDPTPEERLGGIIAGCPLGVFTDVMDREDGRPTTAMAESMEYEADEAAFLAIAPIGTVIARVSAAKEPIERPMVEACLVSDFGLSPSDAERHSPRILSAVARGRPSFVEGLRVAARRKHEGPNR
jgi:hypothetical protein